MFSWRPSNILPIGIEIGALTVRMIQLQNSAGQLSLRAAASADLPPLSNETPEARAAAVTATLRQLLSNTGFSGTRCVTTLAPTQIHVKSIRLPQMPESDLKQAVHWEARDRLGFDLTDGCLEFFRAGEVRRGTEIRDELLLFAVTGDILKRHLQKILAAGLKPQAIDLQPCALLRAIQRVLPQRPNQSRAIVDLGDAGTQLFITIDDRLAFYKFIDIGTTRFDDAIAQKLSIPPQEARALRARLMSAQANKSVESVSPHLEQAVYDALRPALEELARELDMCIRYYVVTFRGMRPDNIILTGYQSQNSRLIETLATNLAIPMESAQPLRGVDNLSQTTRPDQASQWTLATGLSLHPLSQVTKQHSTEVAA